MHSYECFADAIFYRSSKLSLVILAEMKHHFCAGRAILEGDVRPLEREELDPYTLKLLLVHRHILDVSKLVLSTGSGGERRHRTTVLSPRICGNIRIKCIMACSAQCVTSTAFRDSIGGEEHDTSQTPTSQFGEVARSMGRESFTVKSACVLFW
jgi:hypothetical protein